MLCVFLLSFFLYLILFFSSVLHKVPSLFSYFSFLFRFSPSHFFYFFSLFSFFLLNAPPLFLCYISFPIFLFSPLFSSFHRHLLSFFSLYPFSYSLSFIRLSSDSIFIPILIPFPLFIPFVISLLHYSPSPLS